MLKSLRRAFRRRYHQSARAVQTWRRMPHRLAQLEGKLDLLSKTLEEHRLESRLVWSAQTLPDRAIWAGQPPFVAGQPADGVFPSAVPCRQDSFQQPYFSYWTARLGESLRYHRKLWEFVFICQALWERGAIRPGARGLGFGVGGEPLSAYFASQGCAVTATDMEVERAVEMGWTLTNEHAASKEALRRPLVCPDHLFDANVTFRNCDMNAIPDDLTDFDFCWSACALEHLGSIEKGLAFIERSIECLKPGGWAVHTTEYNFSSNTETVDHMDTVLFRRCDFEALMERLTRKGYRVAPFDFDIGQAPLDQYLDLMPYREQPHLKMALWGFGVTSIGVIVQRC